MFASRVLLVMLAATIGPMPASAQAPRHFEGRAVYYDVGYNDTTASGEPYDPAKFTAAHRTLPLGARVRVIDKKTGKSVTVVVNDRGPFNQKFDIDISLAAAKQLDMIRRGVISVRIEVEQR